MAGCVEGADCCGDPGAGGDGDRDALIERKEDRIQRLEVLVAAFKQALFGRKSEKSDPDQFELALEDIEAAMAAIHAEDEVDDQQPKYSSRPRRTNRGSLPKHLPRIEEVIEPEETVCACGAERHIIGEDVSERLDVIPAQFRVIVTRRPKYACRCCEDGIVQTPAPARLIAGGMPTEANRATQEGVAVPFKRSILRWLTLSEAFLRFFAYN